MFGLASPSGAADWQQVKSEAIQATYSNPKDTAAWIRLGEAEEKLGNRAKASEAYGKVVELDASSDNGKIALERLKALGSAPATPVVVETAESPAAPTTSLAPPAPTAPGKEESRFYLAFAPIYKPKMTTQLGSNLKMVADIGFRQGKHLVTALRLGRSVFGSLALPDGTRALRPAHTYVGVLVQGDIPIGPADLLLERVGFIVPLSLTPYMTVVKARDDIFLGMGIDLAVGAGPRITIGETFIDILALYHIGVPILKLKSATDAVLTGTDGQPVTGSTSGFELRLAVTL